MKKIALFILWFLIWCLLVWPPSVKYIVMGAFASLFVTLMTMDTFISLGHKPEAAIKTNLIDILKRIMWFGCYFIIFLREIAKANIDILWRLLHPVLPVRPAIIKIKTVLKSETGIAFLANSITLMPATTIIDVDKEGGFLYVHTIYLKGDVGKIPMEIDMVKKFERVLIRIFE